jgi:hypothetical protein
MVNTSASASTSASQPPKLSAIGRATITGLAILANPRIHASKILVFDAQFYLGPTDEDFILGSLRYFNQDNSSFDDEACLYFVQATVSIRFIICLLISKSVFSLLGKI